MTTDNFLSFLKHFKKYSKPSETNKILLLLDNHASHISLENIDYCYNNFIAMLSFPPHCSHELQPLDKTVYGPFKAYFNQAAQSWLKDPLNIGRRISIHQMPKLIKHAFEKAVVPHNIISGFAATGIYPFSRDAIPDDRYLPSFTTDLPDRLMKIQRRQRQKTMTRHPHAVRTVTRHPHAVRTMTRNPHLVRTVTWHPRPVITVTWHPQAVRTLTRHPHALLVRTITRYPHAVRTTTSQSTALFHPNQSHLSKFDHFQNH